MQMTSPLDKEPPNLSFTMRENNITFQRSISTKEPPLSGPIPLPPRLSATSSSSLSLHHLPQPPTRLVSISPDTSSSTYHCISSILIKEGQILCVAATNGFIYSGTLGNIIRVWMLPEFTECGQLKTNACMVVALKVSNDKVYAAYADCKIRVWRRTWDEIVKHLRVATLPTAGSFIRNYFSGRDRTMRHLGPITSLAVNPSDDVLYSASLDKTVKVWRISDFKCIETIQAHSDPINAIAVSEDGILYTASDDATVRVWHRNYCISTRPHSLTVTLPAKYSPVKTLALSPDGSVLYGGCTDGYVHYWIKGWFSGQLQHEDALPGHTHAVMCLATLGNYVVSGSADFTGRVWVREPGGLHNCIAVLQGHRGPIRCIAVFPGLDESVEEGCTVCTGSVDGVFKVWRVRNTTSHGRDLSPNAQEYFDIRPS